MSYALGIDIGSASLAAAVNDGSSASRMLELGSGSASCPSAVYLGDEGMVVGEQALVLGSEHPELLVRGYLSRVGDDVPIVAGDYVIAAEDVVALVARWTVDRAEELESAPPSTITVAYPTTWGSYRTAVLENALAGVGLGQARLVPAAVAAVADHGEGMGPVVAVYDLGEEFELALLERGASGSFVPRDGGCAESAGGGGDFDDAVFAHVRSALELGEAAEASDGTALARVWQECVEAKEALSFDSEVTIPVEVGDRPTQVRMVRAEFEVLIDDLVHGTIDTAHRAIQSAGLEDEDLSAIVLVGGSSRVPLVAELLSAEFRRPILIGTDPGETVALGAATLGAVDLPDTLVVPPPAPSGLRRPTYVLALTAAAAAAIVVGVTATQAAESPRAVTPQAVDARGLFWPDERTATTAVATDTGAPPAAADSAPSDDTAYTPHGAPSAPREAAVPPAAATHTGQTPSAPAADPQPEPEPSTPAEPEPDPEPSTPADPEPDPTPDPEPEPDPEPAPDPTPDPLPEPADATGLELAAG